LWARHKATVLTVALVLYTIVLGVAVADDVLHLGLFPTRLEAMARERIADLGHEDEERRRKAADELVRKIDAFVAVPALLDALDADSLQRRTLAIECLRRITSSAHGYAPDAPRARRRAAIERWRRWWRENKYRY
ncbi:MAG: hypothetical protein ACODAJ_14920, partial [Planctomycetota bacterium]